MPLQDDVELRITVNAQNAMRMLGNVAEQLSKIANVLMPFLVTIMPSPELKALAKHDIAQARIELGRRGIYRKKDYVGCNN